MSRGWRSGLVLWSLAFRHYPTNGSGPGLCCYGASGALARPSGRAPARIATEPSLTVGLMPRQHTNRPLPTIEVIDTSTEKLYRLPSVHDWSRTGVLGFW